MAFTFIEQSYHYTNLTFVCESDVCDVRAGAPGKPIRSEQNLFLFSASLDSDVTPGSSITHIAMALALGYKVAALKACKGRIRYVHRILVTANERNSGVDVVHASFPERGDSVL